MRIRSLRNATLLLALAAAAPLAAQNESPIRERGVSSNDAAQQLMRADAAEDERVKSGEAREPDETPVAAAPLPTGTIDVGTPQTEVPLEESEEPDPEGDAEDGEPEGE